jgi:hypothetical protein
MYDRAADKPGREEPISQAARTALENVMMKSVQGTRQINAIPVDQLPELTASERTLFAGIKHILTSKKPIKVDQPVCDITVPDADRVEVSRKDGRFVLEFPTYVYHRDLSKLSIEGKGLKDLASPLSKSDEEFFRRLKLVMRSPVHVAGEFGFKTGNSFSGVSVDALNGTELSLRDGKWTFELPAYVSQEGFENVRVVGDAFEKRAKRA